VGASQDIGLWRPRVNTRLRAALEAAYPYPEGRWAWLDVADDEAMTDVMRLGTLKAPPPKRRVAAHT
jgi:hypothetical protein